MVHRVAMVRCVPLCTTQVCYNGRANVLQVCASGSACVMLWSGFGTAGKKPGSL